MGKVLTENTTLHCAATPDKPPLHGGTLKVSPSARLRVDGAPVLTGDDVQQATIVDCGNKAPGQAPCTTVISVSGLATKLRVDGQFVVTDSISGTTGGTPPGTIVAGAVILDRLHAR